MSLLTSSMKPNAYFDISLFTQLWRCNTQKYSLGDSILLAKTNEHTLMYIPDTFQGVRMTKFFRMSVFYRSLNLEIRYRTKSKTLVFLSIISPAAKSFTPFIGVYIARLSISRRLYRRGRTASTRFQMLKLTLWFMRTFRILNIYQWS